MYILIIGCGRLGSNLAKELSNAGHDIAVIDHDSEKISALGSGFNGSWLKGVEFDSDNLLEAGIENADVLLAVSPDDNINMTVSLIAMRIYHVPKIIARVNDPGRKCIYDKLEIETISPVRLGIDLMKSKLTEKGKLL